MTHYVKQMRTPKGSMMSLLTPQSVAAMTLDDFIRPRRNGEVVVSHVVEQVRQPGPDFEGMRQTIISTFPPVSTKSDDIAGPIPQVR